eukprot:CAMPEP_0206309672 /NCGR_PEP_ID=MMETSP0106_2-20121207/12518_1 /ASSEMBLY_ACC=CAM_ASM_000206 /TAXON_ID=81532 /ORGANISM="Acanthoeca-like sp., Strain 10tr" /LENGTH=110 /DNA_ID=CAMNT_0053740795 /DNA_START=36 /DNA_END=370 /DNA_ORIENTATION=-
MPWGPVWNVVTAIECGVTNAALWSLDEAKLLTWYAHCRDEEWLDCEDSDDAVEATDDAPTLDAILARLETESARRSACVFSLSEDPMLPADLSDEVYPPVSAATRSARAQ